MFRLCFRIIRLREEAEDAAQEIFVKLWEHPDDYQPKARFSTWLYRVTTNHCLNRRRYLKLKSFLSFSPNVEVEIYSDSHNKTPEFELVSSEKSYQFQRAFRRLSGRQRAALHLRYWEDLSVREVADVLSITLKSAESLIYRGKKTLGRCLR